MTTNNTTQAQHTPGPWILFTFHNHEYSITSSLSNGTKFVANLYGQAGTFDVNESDARLIAAAPELLEALKLCADKLAMWPEGSNPEFFPSLKAARSAIAKAAGNQA